MNPWTPVSPAQEASPEATAARMAEYDRLCPIWREAAYRQKGRAPLNCQEHAIFALDHVAHTARFIERFSNYGVTSEPFLGITSRIVPHGDIVNVNDLIGRDLQLMETPYGGGVSYTIIP